MRLRPLVLGTVLAAGASSAFAQSQPQVPAVEPKREYDLGLNVSGYYETNVSKSNKATALQRGIEQEDYYIRPQAIASIVQPLGQQALFIRGLAGYDFYDKNDQLNRQRYDVSGGGMAMYFGCREVAYANYREQQSELTDLDAGTTENTQKVTGGGFGLECGRNTGPQGSVVLQKQQSKNSAATRKTSDADNQVALVTLGYSRPSLGTLTLIYNYSDSQFPNRVIPDRPVGDGFFTETLGVGVERKFGSRLRFSGNFGRTELKREYAPPGLKQKLNVTSYSAEAEYKPGSRINVLITGAREVKPSERTGKLYDVAETVEGTVRYRFGTRMTFSVGYRYADVTSNVDTSQNANVVTSSITNTASAGFVYRQSEKASLLLDVRHEDRETNIPSFDYKDTRVGLTAIYNFF